MNVQDDVTRTDGLEKSLQLCIGSKVMLKRNQCKKTSQFIIQCKGDI